MSFEGVAEIRRSGHHLRGGCQRLERHNGPYTDDLKPAVDDMMMNKRVAVRIVPHRVRSWDHHKLGLPRCRWQV